MSRVEIIYNIAGNLFHYHADLISKDDTSEDMRAEPIKLEIKQEEGDANRVKEELSECPVDTAEFSSALAGKIFEEAQELIQNSPWIFEPGENFIMVMK